MDHSLALAFAVASNSLCLFTGAGFTKACAPAAPSWQKMLEQACADLKSPADALAQFAEAKAMGLPLEDCAQGLELLFLREGKDLRSLLAAQIAAVTPDAEMAALIKRFVKECDELSFVTTNYDDVVSSICSDERVAVNYPGKPLAIGGRKVQIYHIHGHVSNPRGLVVTTNDYYDFINRGDYFAQKTLTLLSERTVAILGYSLSDPNLKAILNELKRMRMRSLQRGNIYYITRESVPRFIRDHYEASFGITVVEKTEVKACFEGVLSRLEEARDRFERADRGISKVLAGEAFWKDDYLKLKESLFHIFSVANVNGINILGEDFVRMVARVVARKISFTSELGAWEQYEHLAEWLVYLGSVIEIGGTDLEKIYLDAVHNSMATMSSRGVYGKSWYAYGVWKSKWLFLNLNNRLMIEKHVVDSLNTPDAMSVVSQF